VLSQYLTLTYDGNGNKLTETNQLGNTTTYAYDTINRLIEVTDATGNSIQRLEYTLDNNQKKAYDALGHVVTYIYDKNQHVIGDHRW